MEHVNRTLAELSGEAKDLAFRRPLEQKARDHLIRLHVFEDYDQISAWYTEDITMVLGLDTTLDGEILKGRAEIEDHFAALHRQTSIEMVPFLVVADRGRITCFTETFYKWLGGKREDGKAEDPEDLEEAPFVGWPMVSHGDVLKLREVIVFDLDEKMMVKRVECRQLSMEQLGKVGLDTCARESEKLAALFYGDI
ncbi:hypothetical protein EsH8_II_001522 [Colletotrichum jinshuiense]